MELRRANRENLSLPPGKTAGPKPMSARRPALSDLNRNVNNANEKTKAVKVGPPAITKRPSLAANRPAATQNKTSQKIQPTTIVRQTATSLKRQDSISKHIALFENDTIVGEETSYSTSQLRGVIDVDAKNKNDPFLVAEYAQDIFQHLRMLESKFSIREDYMVSHRSTPRMRSVLVDWIVDVHINFKWLPETLHLTVALLNGYLQVKNDIGRDRLQLVGVTALFLATKYEETYVPEVFDFVYICDNVFSSLDILKMEQDILRTLDFGIGRPLALHFLHRFNKIAGVRAIHHNLAKYMLEICLLEYGLCHIKPSMQAAAACCLSISILNDVADPAKVWTKTLAYYSVYKYSAIKPVMVKLAYYLVKMEKSKYQAVYKKYAGTNYSKISLHSKLQLPLVLNMANEALKYMK